MWLFVAGAGLAEAQGDEVIEDPELSDRSDGEGQGPAFGGEAQAIEDPELEGVIEDPELDDADLGFSADPAFVQSYDLRALYHSRFGVDLGFDDPREEVWEVQQVAQLEALLRHSDTTRVALGLRLRHGFFAREGATPGAAAQRYMLDVLPVAGYLDASPAAGVHIRAGYQLHHLGRFDVLSATNVLAMYDLRSGPTTLPEASEVAQLGLRMDWDLSSSVSLRAVYLPFFVPHLIDVSEGDYALLPPVRTAPIEDSAELMMLEPADRQALLDYLQGNLPRTTRAALGRAGVDAFAPAPDLQSPQGALRMNLRGSAGEVAATAATALERVPGFVAREIALSNGEVLPVLETVYRRLVVLALDGTLALGPIQVGAEASYTFSRSLIVETTGMSEAANFAQLGLRAEWVVSQTFLMVIEGFGAAVTNEPSSGGWGVLEDGRYAYGVVAFAGYAPGRFRFELGAAALYGPSLYLQPRVGYAAADGVEIEVGAHVLEGEVPYAVTQTSFSLAGWYDNVDQVYLGLRWTN